MTFFEDLFKNWIRDVTTFGSIIFHAIIILLFYLLNFIKIGNMLLIGGIICSVLPAVIRAFYFKERPDHQKYKSFIEKLDASSFPSVHSMRAFFLAMMLSSFLQDIFASLFFFLLAAAVAYSRIKLHKHDITDIFFGAIFGVGLGILLGMI